MRIAFYAPLKSPRHPNPSGDRHVARLFIKVLENRGHEVEIASHLRSRDPIGDPQRQARVKALGEKLAQRYIRQLKKRPKSSWPEAWLTYHLYYKAPDWIGPAVCRALKIPYLVAEASVAYKRAGGPWDLSHRAVLDALQLAEGAITLNPHDAACLPEGVRSWPLPPFIDERPFIEARQAWQQHRRDLAERFGLNPERPWILTIAMMRPGDKLESYRLLARALRGLPDIPWQLLVIGDGQAREEVEAAFAWAKNNKVVFAGQMDSEALTRVIPACDVYAWPAVNEAYGIALLEAQAGGLPVVAGKTGGVPAVVADSQTGLLSTPGDTVAFAASLRALLAAPGKRRCMGDLASKRVERIHSLAAAGEKLDAILATASRNYVAPGLPLLDFGNKNNPL